MLYICNEGRNIDGVQLKYKKILFTSVSNIECIQHTRVNSLMRYHMANKLSMEPTRITRQILLRRVTQKVCLKALSKLKRFCTVLTFEHIRRVQFHVSDEILLQATFE